MNRSYLFVPADSERKMKKAADAGADALILDLEDSIAPVARPAARELVRDYLAGAANVWVRINPIDSDDAAADLEAIMPAAPAGIVLPKPRSAADAVSLASMLDDLEHRHGIEAGRTGIIALCTERPAAIFTLGSYVGATPRLSALTWGAEDLSAAIGASSNRDSDGRWLPPFELARSLCLFAAGAAEVPALDTVFTDFGDVEGLATYAANARRDGFSGMLAIHPAQVDVINRAFVPTAAELERAERIVALFAANPGTGTLGMDGEMIDRPHLVQAKRVLQLAKRLAAQ
ncbi:MAG: CoA ester lyase [Gammaproteobacteria bacterium]|nr:CoA ester lyase [Gammaproteobacteria bacterium]MDH3375239.1 CoA ester lyase [Gammaproteobacteria bacterium]MDH3409482.1 CoA ester lyase [Gammaproteobacteria bacterium]MDH3554003.1 CoA ester lyase [Gammaproteobacteria bacterium]